MRDTAMVAAAIALGICAGIVTAMLLGPLDDMWGTVGLVVIAALVVIFQIRRKVSDKS